MARICPKWTGTKYSVILIKITNVQEINSRTFNDFQSWNILWKDQQGFYILHRTFFSLEKCAEMSDIFTEYLRQTGQERPCSQKVFLTNRKIRNLLASQRQFVQILQKIFVVFYNLCKRIFAQEIIFSPQSKLYSLELYLWPDYPKRFLLCLVVPMAVGLFQTSNFSFCAHGVVSNSVVPWSMRN